MIDVYAILARTPRKKPERGASGEPLRFLRVGSLVVATGTVAEAPELSRLSLERRDRFVRELADASDAILPARWGSVLRDEDALDEAISLQAKALTVALESVRGCEQMTLELTVAALPGEERARPRARSKGKKYLEDRARTLAAERSAPELESLRPPLRGLVRDERAWRRADGRILSVRHLIARGMADEYRRVISAAELDVPVRVSGPDPPYAFAPEMGV